MIVYRLVDTGKVLSYLLTNNDWDVARTHLVRNLYNYREIL